MSARAPSRGVLGAWGFALAVASVIAPALPLGAWVAQPPLPLAVLWAAYGWAAEDESSWRAPVILAALGLLHDQMAGGPYGLFPALYLSAYLIGRVAAVVMSAPNLLSLWGGFAVTAFLTVAIARVLAPLALGDNVSVEIKLINPVAMEKGQRFAIREGGRTVGSGVVTKILA